MRITEPLLAWLRAYLAERYGPVPEGTRLSFYEQIEIRTGGPEGATTEHEVFITGKIPNGDEWVRKFPGSLGDMLVRILREEEASGSNP